jgi:hypothetical protein
MREMCKIIYQRLSGFLLVYPFLFFQTNQNPVDNLTIFNRLASIVISEIVAQAAPDTSEKITIQSQSQQHAGSWWIENWFVKELGNRGVTKIYVQQQRHAEDGSKIEFRINDLGVNYIPTKNKKFAIRQFIINLDVRLLDGKTGFVKLLDNMSEQFADTVQVNLLKQLEDKNYPFASAKIPENQGIRTYFEPFVVMATTAGVVYLFFRLRSK